MLTGPKIKDPTHQHFENSPKRGKVAQNVRRSFSSSLFDSTNVIHLLNPQLDDPEVTLPWVFVLLN